jgi:hypothetical protein
MASLTRKPRSKFWFACFRDANGRQRRKSTKTSDRKKAIKIAEQYEQVGQRKMPARAVRETLAELYREMYNASVPTATVRGFVENWLKTKQPEISPATLAFYRKSTNKLLEFLGSTADLDLASVTRTTLVKRTSPMRSRLRGCGRWRPAKQRRGPHSRSRGRRCCASLASF